MDNISESVQDYLKTIYILSQRFERATTNQIASRLKVSPASVTYMIQKLATTEPPLVTYRKRWGTTLTHDGIQAALTVLRRHRLMELYLCEKLGYTWDEVHEEAERLEHVVSQQMMEQITAVLGEPTTNPHGQPIPSPELEMPILPARPLPTLTPGTQTTIQRVRDEDPSLLRYLAKNHLIPGVAITVQACQEDGTMHILPREQIKPVCLPLSMAEQIFVA